MIYNDHLLILATFTFAMIYYGNVNIDILRVLKCYMACVELSSLNVPNFQKDTNFEESNLHSFMLGMPASQSVRMSS